MERLGLDLNRNMIGGLRPPIKDEAPYHENEGTMNILITGGSGLIGKELCYSLIQDGHSVTISSRYPEKIVGFPANVNIQRWEPSLVNYINVIVNLAGENVAKKRWTVTQKRRILQSRTQIGNAITEAVARSTRKPSVIIQSSGIGYYGISNKMVTELTPCGHDFLAKLAVDWEASTAKVEEYGVRRAIIRTGIVLSRAGGALPRMLTPFKFFIGGPLGNGKQWVPWIHIVDEVGAIKFLIYDEASRGPFNLCAPNPVTSRELSNTIGNILMRPAFFRTPGILLKLLFGEMSTMILDGQRAIPERLMELGYDFEFKTVDVALRHLLTK